MDHMNTEVRNTKVLIKRLNQILIDNTSTTGLILEVSVAIKIGNESKLKMIFLNKIFALC
jgi:hypothetical protein